MTAFERMEEKVMALEAEAESTLQVGQFQSWVYHIPNAPQAAG